MAEINSPGSLLVGEGVYMKGSMQVPGTASIDGKLEGDLSADTVIVQTNGAMDGRTTANHVRVAGSLTNTTVANKSLVVESSGLIGGSITYNELEIKKGGQLQGNIYKVGQQPVQAAPAASNPAPARAQQEAPAPAAAPAQPQAEAAPVAAAAPNSNAQRQQNGGSNKAGKGN